MPAAPPPLAPPPPHRFHWRRFLVRKLQAIAGLSTLAALWIAIAGLLPVESRWVELPAGLQLQGVALAVLAVLAWRPVRRHRPAVTASLIAILAAGLSLGQVSIHLVWGSAPRGAAVSALTFAVQNVTAGHLAPRGAYEFLRQHTPDVVGLVATRPVWAARLEWLEDEYADRWLEPRNHSFGMMLFSRRTLEGAETLTLGGSARFPVITGVVRDDADRPIRVLVVHPPPPISRRNFLLRGRQMQDLISFARAQREPVVIMGDLNTTPFSHQFRTLLAETGLRRAGIGPLATWPSFLPGLGLATTHILVDPRLTVERVWTAGPFGSNHRMLLARLGYAGPVVTSSASN